MHLHLRLFSAIRPRNTYACVQLTPFPTITFLFVLFTVPSYVPGIFLVPSHLSDRLSSPPAWLDIPRLLRTLLTRVRSFP